MAKKSDNFYTLRKKSFASDRRRSAQEQRQAVSSEGASQRQGDVFEALGAPQAALKGAVGGMTGGDSQEWFPKGDMPTWAYAAGNTALDLFADPLNAVGLGSVRKGKNLAEAAYGTSIREADKGRLTAPADNYIDNYYVPDETKDLNTAQSLVHKGMKHVQENPDGMLTKAASKVMPGKVNQVKGLSEENMRGAAQSVGSTVNTVIQAAKNTFLETLNPEARALWRSQGVSQTGQNIIKDHLNRYEELTKAIDDARANGESEKVIKELINKRVGERKLAKAGAEAIYQIHQITQSGRNGKVNEILEKFSKQVFDELPQDNSPGTISQIMLRQTPQVKQGKKFVDDPITQQDGDYIENYLRKTWGEDINKVVVKTPENIVSGKHQFDLTGGRNPNMMAIKKIMKAQKTGPVKESWADFVKRNVDEFNKKAEHKVTVDVTEDGEVWLRSSRPGTAIVEGGYNSLHKLEPDGSYTAIMSDEHNFLEKAPVIGKIVTKYLPEKLLAITPPIKGKIGSDGKSIKNSYRHASAARKDALYKKEKKTGERSEKAEELLRQIPGIKADPQAVKGERMRTGGYGLLTGAAINKTQTDEEKGP